MRKIKKKNEESISFEKRRRSAFQNYNSLWLEIAILDTEDNIPQEGTEEYRQLMSRCNAVDQEYINSKIERAPRSITKIFTELVRERSKRETRRAITKCGGVSMNCRIEHD